MKYEPVNSLAYTTHHLSLNGKSVNNDNMIIPFSSFAVNWIARLVAFC